MKWGINMKTIIRNVLTILLLVFSFAFLHIDIKADEKNPNPPSWSFDTTTQTFTTTKNHQGSNTRFLIPEMDQNTKINLLIKPSKFIPGQYGADGFMVVKEIDYVKSTKDNLSITSADLNLSYPNFDENTKTQLASNKLYGTKVGSDQEQLILTNLADFNPSQRVFTDFDQEKQGEYTKIHLVFDNPILIQHPNQLNFHFYLQGNINSNYMNNYINSGYYSFTNQYKMDYIYDVYRKYTDVNDYYLETANKTISNKSNELIVDKQWAQMQDKSISVSNPKLGYDNHTLLTANYELHSWFNQLTLDNSQIYVVVPDGISLDTEQLAKLKLNLINDDEDIPDSVVALKNPKIIKNFNGTNKTAIIADFAYPKQPGYQLQITNFKFDIPLVKDKNIKNDDRKIEVYLKYDNNNGSHPYVGKDGPNQINTTTTANNPYGIYTNTNNPNQVNVLTLNNIIDYDAPITLNHHFEVKKANENDDQYVSDKTLKTYVDQNLNYHYNIFNNTPINIDQLGLITLINPQDNQFKQQLLDQVKIDNPLFDIYYSTEKINDENIKDLYNADIWTKELNDYSKVTMIKAVLKTDSVIAPQANINFNYDYAILKDKNLRPNQIVTNTIYVSSDNGEIFDKKDITKVELDYHTNNLNVVVRDAKANNTYLKGLEYQLYYYANNQLVDDSIYTTNQQGQITINNLRPEKYYLKEIKTIKNYPTVSDLDKEKETNSFTIKNEENQPVSLNIEKTAAATITIKDVDKINKTPIKNAVFELYDNDDKLLTTQTTNHAGLAYFKDLSDKRFFIKQKGVPKEYKLNSEYKTYLIKDATKDNLVEFNNTLINDDKDTNNYSLAINTNLTINLKTHNTQYLQAYYDTRGLESEYQNIYFTKPKNTQIIKVTKALKDNQINQKQNFEIKALKEGTTTFEVYINYPNKKISKTIKVQVINQSNKNNKYCNQIIYDKDNRLSKRYTCHHNGNIEKIVSYTYLNKTNKITNTLVKYYSYKHNLRVVKKVNYSNYYHKHYLTKVIKYYNDNKTNRLYAKEEKRYYKNNVIKEKTSKLYFNNGIVKYKEIKDYNKQGKVKQRLIKEYYNNQKLHFERGYFKYKGQ